MYRRCVSQGSLAAVLAALCVLSLGPSTMSAAVASGGGIASLPHDLPRCCAPGEPGADAARGVKSPGASAAIALAQAGTTSEQAPTPQPAPDPPPTTELPQNDTKIPVTVPADATESDAKGSFEGSPKPAEPDLTPNEEREMISRGWQ